MSIAPMIRARIRSSAAFSSLSDSDFTNLLAALRERVLRQGEVLCRQGEAGDSLVILGSGRMAVHFGSPNGPAILLGEVAAGEVLGEMSCLDPAPRSATVTALETCLVYEMNRNLLHSLREHSPVVARSIVSGVIQQVTGRLQEQEARTAQMIESFVAPRTQAPAPAPIEKPFRTRAESDRAHRHPIRWQADSAGMAVPEGLTSADIDILAGVGQCLALQEGDYLCRQGETAASCFLLLKGKLEVVWTGAGRTWLLATLEPGSVAGQIALVGSPARSADLRAKGQGMVLEIGRDAFERLLAAASPIGLRFQELIAVAGIRQHRRTLLRLARAERASGASEARTQGPAGAGGSDSDIERLVSGYLAGLKEWGVGPAELASARFIKLEGEIPPEEIRVRLRLE